MDHCILNIQDGQYGESQKIENIDSDVNSRRNELEYNENNQRKKECIIFANESKIDEKFSNNDSTVMVWQSIPNILYLNYSKQEKNSSYFLLHKPIEIFNDKNLFIQETYRKNEILKSINFIPYHSFLENSINPRLAADLDYGNETEIFSSNFNETNSTVFDKPLPRVTLSKLTLENTEQFEKDKSPSKFKCRNFKIDGYTKNILAANYK